MVTADNWDTLVEAVHAEQSDTDEKLPALNCLMSQSICPAGLVTSLSWALLQAYNACGGLARIASPKDYYDLPALYVDGCSVIDAEKAKYQVTNGDK